MSGRTDEQTQWATTRADVEYELAAALHQWSIGCRPQPNGSPADDPTDYHVEDARNLRDQLMADGWTLIRARFQERRTG